MSISQRTCIIFSSTVFVNGSKQYISHVDPDSRKELYLKSIKNWLDNTTLNIVLVENSGYKFSELDEYLEKYSDRFEMILFKEDELEQKVFDEYDCRCLSLKDDYLYTSKGTSEMFCICYVKDISRLAKKSDYIIKITARYFVPQFQTFLDSIPDEFQALRQNNADNCEIVGCHKDSFRAVFWPNNFQNFSGSYTHHIESMYKERIERIEKVVVCDQFEIEPTKQGGYDTIITSL